MLTCPQALAAQMNMKHVCLLFWLAGLTGLTLNVHATITVVDYWRMGENDPGAASGNSCTNTLDVVSGRTLTNTPVAGVYPVYTNNVSSQAAAAIGSRLSLALSGGRHGAAAVIPSLTNNFGIELWVYPMDTAGGKVVAYNGDTGASGWGIYQNGTTYAGLFGNVGFIGSAPVTVKTWTHLALVRNNGIATLYVNGVAAGSITSAPNSPAGTFLVGANNSGGETFSGWIDEVRVFTNGPGQFSTNDLLVSASIVTSAADSGAGSLRQAIAQATPGATIVFAGSLAGQTITLTNGPLVVTNTLTVDASALSSSLTISGNNASRVMAISNNATVILNALTLANGKVSSAPGGGIYNSAGCTLTLNRDTLAANSATGEGGIGGAGLGGSGGVGAGGGIYNAGTLTLNQSTLANNSAIGGTGGSGATDFSGGTGGNGDGGGIYNAGTLTLNQVTLSGNSATGGDGGAAGKYGSGGNGGNGTGGAIYNTGTLSLNHVTLSANSAGGGVGGASGGPRLPTGLPGTGDAGGLYNASSPSAVTLHNCLLALNSGASSPDMDGGFTSLGHNLLGLTGNSTGLINGVNGDLVGTAAAAINPALGPLTNNGGRTSTMALLSTSPAIDAGDDSLTGVFATDQRGTGYPRLRGQHLDIGAYEFDTTSYGLPTIASVGPGSVILNPATGMGSVTTSASVNPNGLAATAWLQFGATTAYGATTAPVMLGNGSLNVPVSLAIVGLPPGVAIHYRVAAASAAGTTVGLDQAVNISSQGDFDGDGKVSSSEMSTVYSNYLSGSPPLRLGNVAGLGGPHVTFSLTNLAFASYSVQCSTDLVNWYYLGPASPRYLFTDPEAPALPRRFYRLTYP